LALGLNVGLPIELPEFDQAQVLDLARQHGWDWDESQGVDLMAMVGGHPYLVRMALDEVARGDRCKINWRNLVSPLASPGYPGLSNAG
jgi:hypothetical protein